MQRTSRCSAGCVALVLAVVAATGCASPLAAAGAYQDRGKHELAVYYYGAHFRSEPADEEAKALLKRSIDNALATIKAAYDDKAAAGDHRAALGVATRKAELLSFARSVGLADFDAVTAKPELDASWSKASTGALGAVDEAAEAGGTPGEQLALLREALALDPHNAELATRYARTQSGLTRTLSWRVQCEPAVQRQCEALAAKLLELITTERREIMRVATDASQTKNTELVLRMDATVSDTSWKRKKKGKVKAKVPRLDKFKEQVVNRKGKKVFDEVKAVYELHERTAKASLSVRVEVRDLGPSGKVLFERDQRKDKVDTRQYVTWQGDERALGDLAKRGTDRSPPTPPHQLARQAADEAAAEMAKQLLTELERVKS